MADTTKTTETLIIDNIFLDGDTRSITLKNPKDSISAATIESLSSWMNTNQPIIGDKTHAAFGRIRKVTKRTKTATSLDIEST